MAEYKTWECQVCAWIYDEAKGWPEDGIAPGTRWEDIPNDWLCPECGVGKDDFDMIEVARSTTETTAPAPAPQIAATGKQFQVWECLVCGWIYDEAKGWPEDGIEPGTRWADVPNDWLCPECGVGKEDFEMVAVSLNPAPATSATAAPAASTEIDYSIAPLVIIGTGLAGYNLAKEFRKLDQRTPITMITSDDGYYYSKPLLSTGFHKQKTPADIASYSPTDMAKSLKADIHIFTRVMAIDRSQQSIEVSSGTRSHNLTYGKLVLGVGSQAIEAPVEGNAAGLIYTINDLQDYARFHAAAVGKKKVLIIGAGLIGSEYTNDLIQSGFDIDVVDPLDGVLGNLLPPAVSQSVRAKLEQAGARFHFGTVVKQLNRSTGGVQATLGNGEVIEADIVLSAIGVRARLDIALQAGLETNRGIITNRQLQTSDANIYALGDCAEVDGHLLYYIAPMLAGCRALAATLTGNASTVHYGTMPVTIKTTLCPIVVSPPARDRSGEWRVENHGTDGVEAVFYGEDEKVYGFALSGNCISSSERLTKLCAGIMLDV